MLKFWRAGLALCVILAGCVAPAPPASPACDRFAPSEPDRTARHEPPVPDLPAPPARTTRAFRSAVHTVFIDETVARLAVEAGFDTLVQVWPWRDLQSEPDRFTWAAVDALVAAAVRHGLDIVARLDMPPAWAVREATSGLPFDLAAYTRFVAAAAARYRGYVLGYIIWNEPNLAAEWSRSGGTSADHWEAYTGWVADPADYLGVVGAAHRAIRAADPQALVIAGGLAPTNEVSERALDDREFLRQLYAAGAPDCFDVLAVHAYGYGLAPDADPAANDGLNLARVEALRAILTGHGDRRPVWITELGYTLRAGDHPAVTEQRQAQYLVGAYRRVCDDWPWIEMLTVWNLSYGRPPEEEASGFSLVAPDLTPRPAYAALQALNQRGGCRRQNP